jgi:polyhydroxyalkanoate synthesis regulator phasin
MSQGVSQEQGKQIQLRQKISELKQRVSEINNVLKNSKLNTHLYLLEIYAEALDALMNKNRRVFSFELDCEEKHLLVRVRGVLVAELPFDEKETISQIFDKLFSSEKAREYVINKICEKIAEISKEIVENADVFREVAQLEDDIYYLESQLNKQ